MTQGDGTHRLSFLEANPIAIGGAGDPAEFARELRRIGPLLPARSPLHMLDVACGTGAWSIHWRERGEIVTGLDFDLDLLARARQRPGLGDPAGFRGVVADATKLPFKSGSFDLVMVNSLLEHVPDWKSAVVEAARVVAPGGVLVLHTTNRVHPFQGEVRGFPFYPWLPRPLRDRVLAWIMKHRRDLVNYTESPAVNWFWPPELSEFTAAQNLIVRDRLDLMRPEDLTGVRAIARWMLPKDGRPARARFLYWLATRSVSLYAKRPESQDSDRELASRAHSASSRATNRRVIR